MGLFCALLAQECIHDCFSVAVIAGNDLLFSPFVFTVR